MSSQDNEPDTRQRTVAELLAQYGSEQNGDKPRAGRRRRAEDGADDTAPQAIIDRVLGDSGSMRAVDGNATPHTPRAQRRQPPQGPPDPEANQGQLPPQAPQPQAPPAPPANAAPQPNAAPPASQVPQANAAPPVPARPPQEQAKQPTRMIPPVAPPADQPTQFSRPLPRPPAAAPPAAQNPGGAAPGASPLAARLSGNDEQHTEQFGPVHDEYAEEDTNLFTHEPEPDEDDLAEPEEAADGRPRRRGKLLPGRKNKRAVAEPIPEPAHDEHYDDYADEPHDLVHEDLDEPEDGGHYDDYEPEPTSGREWLTLVGLIAAGVIGGAAVWLGFDWLWGQMKIAAAVAAVVVTVLVVIGVRLLWKARDVQTTVFAVIVGLVVTASPAVLLLFGK